LNVAEPNRDTIFPRAVATKILLCPVPVAREKATYAPRGDHVGEWSLQAGVSRSGWEPSARIAHSPPVDATYVRSAGDRAAGAPIPTPLCVMAPTPSVATSPIKAMTVRTVRR